MHWIEITVFTTDAGIEPVTAALSGAGIDCVSIEESAEAAMSFLNERTIFWDFVDLDRIGAATPCVKAYLPAVPASDHTLAEVKRAVQRLRTLSLDVELGSLDIVASQVDDADWKDNWKAYYKPLPIGDRLLVVPSWEPVVPTPGRATLVLDPGVAFGTGSHHTTRMCLELLEAVVPESGRVLDLGCGSGILSIAALLLGADTATAVDIDPITEHIAKENAERNGVDPAHYTVHIGDATSDAALQQSIAGQYDLVLSNIVSDIIIRLAPLMRASCKPGAPLIASGVIDERKDEVISCLQAAGFTVETVLESGGWVAILARG